MSVCCAVKGNPTQFNLVSCTLQRKFKELKQNKTKWYKVRVRQERKQSAGVFASKYVSVRPRRKWLLDAYGQLWDVDGCCGCIRHTDIYVYIYTYSHWSWDQHAMGTKHSTEQERDFTWSCLQKWGLAWRFLRGCSSARSRTQVGVEYDVNETCKMIKAYLRLVMACYGIGSECFKYPRGWFSQIRGCWNADSLGGYRMVRIDGCRGHHRLERKSCATVGCHEWQKHAKSAM